jgi:putative transposase
MKVKLNKEAVRYLEEFIRKGKKDVRQVKRAQVFLYLHQGLSQQQAGEKAGVCSATVSNLVKRYKEVGQDITLSLADAPRPGQPAKLVASLQAHITALACSQTPSGQGKWTLRLLRDRVVELGYAPDGISHEAVRQCLKKVSSNLGRAANGASGK